MRKPGDRPGRPYKRPRGKVTARIRRLLPWNVWLAERVACITEEGSGLFRKAVRE